MFSTHITANGVFFFFFFFFFGSWDERKLVMDVRWYVSPAVRLDIMQDCREHLWDVMSAWGFVEGVGMTSM
jgi:hypothetical protein